MTNLPVAVLLLTLLGSLAVRSQSAGSLDTNFVAVAGTDAAPSLMAPLPDGRLYVGGTFTNYGGSGRARVARLLPGGQVDPAFTLPALLQVNPAVVLNGQVLLPASTNAGNVTVLLALPDGRLVIGGGFNRVGAVSAPGLALLNLDGAPAVTSFDLEDGDVSALLPGPGGTFYAGVKGSLASQRMPLLRFRPDGSRDPGFNAPTLAELGYQSVNPFTLRLGPGDTLYVVTAAAVNLGPTSDILRLTSTGALDTTFAGTGKAGIPFANLSSFVTDGSGRMVFANVTSYRGVSLARKINRLTLDGALDESFQSTVNPGQGGRVVAAQADGKVLYTGGAAAVQRLNADGSVDTGYVDPGKVPVRQSFLSLVFFVGAPDGSLYAGGFTFSPTFQAINGVYHILGDPNAAPAITTEPLAQTNTFGARTRFLVLAQGAAPLAYQWYRNGVALPGATEANLVLETTSAADREAEFHCVVSNALGSTPSRAARLTLVDPVPGAVFRETDPPMGANAEVLDLQWDATGGLLAGGGFTKFNETNRVRVARLIDNGRRVDPGFDTAALGNVGLVEQVVALRDGRVLLAGNVSASYAGRTHGGLLRLGTTGALDTGFNVAGSGGSLGSRPAEGPDGVLYLAGGFWNDVLLPSGVARLSIDGVRDAGFVPSPSFSGAGAVLALPEGRVLAAGRPDSLTTGSRPLRLNTDGSQDLGFNQNVLTGLSQTAVTAMLRQPDGKILVAGQFTTSVRFQSYTLGVIRLLEDGRLDPEFNAVPSLSALDGFPVRRLVLQADGRILILGAFTRVGGFARPGVARLWPNGAVDPTFAPGSPRKPFLSGNPLGTVAALAVSPGNEVFLGGDFHEFEGVPRTNYVQVIGGPLRPVPAAPTVVSQPTRVIAKAGSSVTLTVEPGGDGPFQYQWRRNETTGSTNFMDLIGETNASLTLPAVRFAPTSDSGLFQLHILNPGGHVASADIVLLVEPDPVVPGTVDRSFAAVDARGILTGQPQIADVDTGGRVVVSMGSTVVRLLEDGTPDLTFRAPEKLTSVPDGGVAAVKRQPDGKVLVAGRLQEGALARLLPDGSYDPAFIRTHRYTGFFQEVPWQIGLQSDGRILLAGTFSNFAGQTVHGLLRFLPNGEVDPAFPLTMIEAVLPNPTRVLPGTVVGLHVLPDDRIYIGGGFNRVHGQTRVGVARLLADGSLDTSFVPPTVGATSLGTGGPMLIYTMGPVTPAGGVYLFGTFVTQAGRPAESAVRLLPDGTVDASFHVSTDFQINTGAVQGDGKLIVSGQFTRLNGVNRAGFARLNLDGTTDETFTQGLSFGVGAPMNLLADGKLLIGGQRVFTGEGPALPAQKVAFVLKPGGLELSWPAGYQLQRATNLAPADWQPVPNPSPFTVPPSGPGAFFRAIAVP